MTPITAQDTQIGIGNGLIGLTLGVVNGWFHGPWFAIEITDVTQCIVLTCVAGVTGIVFQVIRKWLANRNWL